MTVIKKETGQQVQKSPSTDKKTANKEVSAQPTIPSTKKTPQKEETTTKKTPRGRNTRSKK